MIALVLTQLSLCRLIQAILGQFDNLNPVLHSLRFLKKDLLNYPIKLT